MYTFITRTIGVLAIAGLFFVPIAADATDRHGPMKTGLYEVQIDEVEVSGWKTVTIPGISVEQGSYREGNEAKHEQKLWGQVVFADLEMERGVKPGDTKVEYYNGQADSARKEISVKFNFTDNDKNQTEEKSVIVRYNGNDWSDTDDEDSRHVSELVNAFPDKIKDKLASTYEELLDTEQLSVKEANGIMAAGLITLDEVTATDFLDEPLISKGVAECSANNEDKSDDEKNRDDVEGTENNLQKSMQKDLKKCKRHDKTTPEATERKGRNPQTGKEIKIPAK